MWGEYLSGASESLLWWFELEADGTVVGVSSGVMAIVKLVRGEEQLGTMRIAMLRCGHWD